MEPIVETSALKALCQRLSAAPYVTVDTEFMRDRTYWPRLCLIQIAGPEEAAIIDPLAPDLDLDPLLALLVDRRVLKVFHAARQDVEIFFHLSGRVPEPLFDTQVAAMVCGFGDSVGYETLAAKLALVHIDKSMRFTDWSRRPLGEKQLHYALSDVTHLRVAYEKLAARLKRTKRQSWVEEEMETLTNPGTYRADPEEAWRRLKPRKRDPRHLAVLREVAAWRERAAQTRDLPRGWILKDDAVVEIAVHAPRDRDGLERLRAVPRGLAKSEAGNELLAAVRRGQARPESERPTLPRPREPVAGVKPLTDLLKVLLKMKCEAHHVASKLVASAADIEAFAAGDTVPALHGWRREVFGEDALALKAGRLALAAENNRIRLVRLEAQTQAGEGMSRTAGDGSPTLSA
jgi:ribonuclease D